MTDLESQRASTLLKELLRKIHPALKAHPDLMDIVKQLDNEIEGLTCQISTMTLLLDLARVEIAQQSTNLIENSCSFVNNTPDLSTMDKESELELRRLEELLTAINAVLGIPNE